MKTARLRAVTVFSVVALMAFLGSFAAAQCPDILTRGHLNIMTINLLFSEIQDREMRLERIADFVADQTFTYDEAIDLILLQEVVGGFLSKTVNSGFDLKSLLAQRRLNYFLSYRLANGLPGILSVGNAILSRCEIAFTLSTILPFVTEEPFQGFTIPLKRNAMMSRIKVPGFGNINVYNTHLCAYCDPGERLEQALVLADFIGDVENFIPGKNPMILGGDFNTDLNLPEDFPVYSLITRKLGFTDTYRAVHPGCTSCCSPTEGDAGCTFAVLGDPYAVDPFTHQPETPARIDYIFTKGTQLVPVKSSVVFNAAPNAAPDWVSDHSAVLTKIDLD